MAAFVVRIAMPDRPGALGAVASRIGAVRADVIGIEILARTDGRAVDEIVVELADKDLVPLLRSEIAEVDGVDVEEVRALPEGWRDRRFDAYETAAELLQARTPAATLAAAAGRARLELDARWACVVDAHTRAALASDGRPPDPGWLAAVVVEAPPDGPMRHDLAWGSLPSWDAILAVGRADTPFGPHDVRRLRAIAALVDARWIDVSSGPAGRLTPRQSTAPTGAGRPTPSLP